MLRPSRKENVSGNIRPTGNAGSSVAKNPVWNPADRTKVTNREMTEGAAEAIQAPLVWQKGFRGQGVKVLLLDSGISREHPALQDRILKARDFTNSQVSLGVPYPEYDISGHATHIAATILGNGHNGLYGVAPEADLYVAKVCVFLCNNLDGLIEALEWGLEQNVQVINMSFNSSRTDAWKNLGPHIFEKLEDKQVVVVASAGNRGLKDGKILFPANMNNVLTVGAFDGNGDIAPFSSYGENLDILAPGTAITSASLMRGINSTPTLRIDKDGTSMATPHVVGTVALMLSACPTLTPTQVRDAIKSAADRDPDHNSLLHGAGRLNAHRALELIHRNCST